jgi:hypothetical protein
LLRSEECVVKSINRLLLDTGHLSWIVIDGEHVPVAVVNEYLIYLHRLGRSPNTVRAYAHHLQAYWAFLVEQKHDWRELKLTQLAEFVSWVRHAARGGTIVPMHINRFWLLLGRSALSGQAWGGNVDQQKCSQSDQIT